MTTTAEMPKISYAQVRKYDSLTVGSCDFPEFDLSIEELLKKAEEGKKSTSSEIITSHKQNFINSFQGTDYSFSSGNYLIPELLSKKATVFPDLQDNQEEIEETFLRGFQPINHQHKVLFTQKIEIKTSELRRRRPNIVINPILFEDDE